VSSDKQERNVKSIQYKPQAMENNRSPGYGTILFGKTRQYFLSGLHLCQIQHVLPACRRDRWTPSYFSFSLFLRSGILDNYWSVE
jgi:hypothetical protein